MLPPEIRLARHPPPPGQAKARSRAKVIAGAFPLPVLHGERVRVRGSQIREGQLAHYASLGAAGSPVVCFTNWKSASSSAAMHVASLIAISPPSGKNLGWREVLPVTASAKAESVRASGARRRRATRSSTACPRPSALPSEHRTAPRRHSRTPCSAPSIHRSPASRTFAE